MDKRWVARVSRAGICAVLLATACSGGKAGMLEEMAAQSEAATAVFPAADWTKADPTELGFDAAKLEEIAAESVPETECLLVARHGEIVGEWYFNGRTPDQASGVMSVTQAYSATLIGIAEEEGLLDLDDPVSKYIPEWVGTESEDVTIRNILSHDSGRTSTNSIGNTELHQSLVGAPNPGELAIGLEQEHAPGEVWSQNLPAIELLNPILTAATGQDPADYAQAKLFTPIGATNTHMEKNGTGVTWMHAFLETTCRDAARFGHLYLRHGNWDGSQVVSEEFINDATHPSQELNAGWGFMWWLNQPGSLVSVDNMLTPDYEEPSNLKLVPDAPDDMYWALGFGGRFIQVHPATDTVVVRLGDGDEAANMQQVTRLITEAFVGDG
jgi:CubicO group peptidase (beta-lactamase class C family)